MTVCPLNLSFNHHQFISILRYSRLFWKSLTNFCAVQEDGFRLWSNHCNKPSEGCQLRLVSYGTYLWRSSEPNEPHEHGWYQTRQGQPDSSSSCEHIIRQTIFFCLWWAILNRFSMMDTFSWYFSCSPCSIS